MFVLFILLSNILGKNTPVYNSHFEGQDLFYNFYFLVVFFWSCTHCLCLLIYLLIWLCWVFAAAHGLSVVSESRGYSLGAVYRLLIAVVSLAGEHRLLRVAVGNCGAEPR